MADGKIEFQLGRLSFSGQGSEAWVASQLEFLLTKLPELTALPAMVEDEVKSDQSTDSNKKLVQVGSLASHIKLKGGDSNQTQRFLATADWLRLKGEKNLKTALISKALLENHQKKLSNPAESLNQNVSKGYCEKASGGFFISTEGLKALGHND